MASVNSNSEREHCSYKSYNKNHRQVKRVSERILVRKIEHNLWQWRQASAQGQWSSDVFYTGDINLLKESVEGRLVFLILPGQDVVSQLVDADIKDRKQLLKILPYEIEDAIIDQVEDLHFVYGAIENDTIPVAYMDTEWLQSCIDEIEGIGAEVQRCSADYFQLVRSEAGWTFLLENGILMASLGKDVGFSVEQPMAGAYLNALLTQENLPSELHLYGDSTDSLKALQALLPESLIHNETVVISAQEAGYWDLITPSAFLNMDFRSGRFARKLPFDKAWQEFRLPIVAAAAAFLIALGTHSMGLKKAEAERKRIMVETNEIYRQAIPQGNITDPVRQLRTQLGGGSGKGGSSKAVELLVGVAPSIKSVGDVSIRSFRYNLDSGQLQLNLEAKSFDSFENVRSKITETGLNAEIKSANVYGDVHQAQLRVSEAG